MKRRQFVVAVGGSTTASLSGCLSVFEESPSLLESEFILENHDDGEHTFHVALELENRVLEWESQRVETMSEESIVIEPPEDAFPVALHAAVDDEADRGEFRGLSELNEDFCMEVKCAYKIPTDPGIIIFSPDTDSC